MALSGSFTKLDMLLDEYEASGAHVRDVTTKGSGRIITDGALSVEIELGFSLCEMSERESDAVVSYESMTVDSDGTLQVELVAETSLVSDDANDDVSTSLGTPSIEDGTVILPVTVAISISGDGDGWNGTSNGELERGSDNSVPETSERRTRSPARDTTETNDVPVFRDEDRLRRAYESCNTFAEMADELALDVTAETIRRYMIDADIHTPTPYNTSSGAGPDDEADSDDGEPTQETERTDTRPTATDSEQQVVADGIGLPEETSVDELVGIIKQSNTIREVSKEMGIERKEAHEILKELNLMEFVLGRLSTESRRNVTRDDIIDRLRGSTAS